MKHHIDKTVRILNIIVILGSIVGYGVQQHTLSAVHEERLVNNNKRFDDIDKRFDKIDAHLDKVDEKFDNIYKRDKNLTTFNGNQYLLGKLVHYSYSNVEVV